MESLPAELKSHIVMLSSDSSNSLAALACTHSAYQREAEKALYHTLSIFANYDDSLKCMETLVTNSEKAALVHFLTVEYAREDTIENQRLTSYLSKSLINMHSLSDFRVRSGPDEDTAEMIKGLSKILCQGHFRLQTLYWENFLDISQIIKSQTELQILALYNPISPSPRDILITLKELHKAQLFLPIILTLETEGHFLPFTKRISIFPAYYSVDRRSTIPQVLAQSFRKDPSMFSRAESVRELSTYLFDSSDIPSIYALAKGIDVNFPKINYLYLCFECQCEISLLENEDFSSFSNLENLSAHVLT